VQVTARIIYEDGTVAGMGSVPLEIPRDELDTTVPVTHEETIPYMQSCLAAVGDAYDEIGDLDALYHQAKAEAEVRRKKTAAEATAAAEKSDKLGRMHPVGRSVPRKRLPLENLNPNGDDGDEGQAKDDPQPPPE